MDDKLISQIAKLGHELEEIRVRALTNIISKLDLGILSERDLFKSSDIFLKLLEWFEFPAVPCKKDVLHLISRLVQNEDGAFYLGVSDPGLGRLENNVGAEFPEELCRIRQNMEEHISSADLTPLSVCIEQHNSENSSHIQTISTDVSNRSREWEYTEIYWPVPRLDESDARVLKSVADLLTDRSQSPQVASFFSSVLLHDFPPQVFLQDTSILNALFKLYREEGDHESILSCFKEFTLSLQRQFKLYEDPASIETVCHVSRDGDELALCETTNHSHSLIEQLGVGEYCALSLERLGHRLPSALRLLCLTIRDPVSFWEAVSGAFLKESISNHLLALVTKIKEAEVNDPLGRLEAQAWLSQVLTTLIPLSVASTVLPKQLQQLLFQQLFDPSLHLLYPKVHKIFKEYVSVFQYLDKTELEVVERLGESLEAAARLGNEQLPVSQTLRLLHSSISSFDIHRDYSLIPLFFGTLIGKTLLPSESELAERILLSLMSHLEETVQEETYSEFTSVMVQVFGPSASTSRNNLEFERIKFILTPSVLKEILNFGITSDLPKVRKSAETVWRLMLKAKLILGADDWMALLSSVTSCFPLLQALASQGTALGRAVLQMFDPDVATNINLHKLQVLIGNVRFLFSVDRNVSSEGYTRLAYLLGIPPGTHLTITETPIFSQTLTSVSLFNEGTIPRLVELVRREEGDMLRSAVVQIGLVSEQPSLHIPLIEAGALPLLLHVLQSALETVSEHSKEIFAAIVLVLKNLAIHNIQIRSDFSVDYNIYSNVIKGLLVLSQERRWLSDATQLLALLAYSDCIVISDSSLSLPKLLTENLRLPFPVRSHSLTSTYTVQSQKSVLSSRREGCVYLGSIWCYTVGGGPGAVLDRTYLPPAPLQLPSSKTFLHLPTQLRNSLTDLKTASSHQAAMSALSLVSRFLALVEYVSEGVGDLPWEESFSRYLLTVPASPADQILLIQILRVLSHLVCNVNSQVGWISNFLRDPAKMLCSLLTQTTVEDTTSVRKELSLELLGLVEQCLRVGGSKDWGSVSTILLQSLNYSHTQKFYTLAVVDGLLRCLLRLSDEVGIPGNEGPLWKLLAAFHCPSNTSFMGLTITRRVLFALNSVVSLVKELKVREEAAWIWKVLSSRDWLAVSAALELTCRLSISPQNLNLLLQYLPHLWDLALRLVLDHRQSCLVREQAAFLCCNIVMNTQNKNYVMDFVEKEAFEAFTIIYARHKMTKKPREIFIYHSSAFQDDSDEYYYNGASTKKLVTHICCLSVALMMKDHSKIVTAANKSGFILNLARDLTEWRCERIDEQETVEMYEAVVRVLVHSYSSSYSGYFFDETIQTLIWLILPSTYGEGLVREGVTLECLRLVSLLVSGGGGGEKAPILPREAVGLLATAVRSTDPVLSSAAAAAITALAPAFSQQGSVDLLRAMGTRESSRTAVGAIVANSQCAALAGLELGLLPDCLSRLAQLQLALAITPRNTKKSMGVLESVSTELGVLTNFLAGCGAAKEEAALLGLADHIHKLWSWTLTDVNLLTVLLRALITFTADSPKAAGTLVLTSTLAGVGQRKTPTSLSLLHAVLGSLLKEVFPSKVKILFLELISHAVQAPESRNVIAKSNVLSEFLTVHSQKKSGSVDEMEVAWLELLTVFTSYPEGQAAVVKNEEVAETLVDYLSGGRGSKHRGPAMAVIRNIAFNQTFRKRLLLSTECVLGSVGERLADLSLPDEELCDILLLVWVLAANSQRGKAAVRASGLFFRLDSALGVRPRPEPVASLSQILLPILQS